MNKDEALSKMKAPGDPRPQAWRGGVIQIWVTRVCDKCCNHCTQGSNLKGAGRQGCMPVELFREAVVSLAGYSGVIGVFGGNPALHPAFRSLCEILQELVPFEQRGLWCNKPFGHGAVMRETFNPRHSNLNVHQDQAAYDEFKRDWPECTPVGLRTDSRHAPVFASMVDLGVPEAQRWQLISECDINQYWSAMIGVFRGELRAWFCEIAGAQAMLKQFDTEFPDTGRQLVPRWWALDMTWWSEQVEQHCHHCVVPLRGEGHLANDREAHDQMSPHWSSILETKRGTLVDVVHELDALHPQSLRTTTDYLGNAK